MIVNNLLKVICFKVTENKVGDRSRGGPEGFLFNSYKTDVGEGATLFPGLPHFTLNPYPLKLSVM